MATNVAAVPYEGPPHYTGEPPGYTRFDSAFRNAQQTVDSYDAAFRAGLDGLARIAEAITDMDIAPPDQPAYPAYPSFPDAPDLSVDEEIPELPEAPPEVSFTPPAERKLPTLSQSALPSTPTPPVIAPDFPSPPELSPVVLPSVPDLVPFEQKGKVDPLPSFPADGIPAVPSPEPPRFDAPQPPDFSGLDTDIPAVPDPVLPEFPSDQVPDADFDFASVPVPPRYVPADLVPPTFYSYVKELLEKYVEQMLSTGQLDQAYEQASFDAAMSREVEAAQKSLGSIAETWAASGFVLPPGAMFEQDLAVRRELQTKAREASRGIYATRRKAELDIRQAALQAGNQILASDTQRFIALQNFVLEHAKFIDSHQLAMFQSALQAAQTEQANVQMQVQVYTAQIERLRALWAGYEVRGRVEASKYTAIQAQLSAVGERLRVAQSQASVYSSQVQGARAALEADLAVYKTPFDLWRVQAEAVLTKYKTWESYGAFARAQASAISAEAQAYQAYAQGYRAQIDNQTEAMRAEAEFNQTRAAIYASQAQAESSRLQALGRVGEVMWRGYSAAVEAITAKIRGDASVATAEGELNRALQTAAASAFQANLGARTSRMNAFSALYNAHAAMINAKGTGLRAKVLAYGSALDKIAAVYATQVRAVGDGYNRALAAWQGALERGRQLIDLNIRHLSNGLQEAGKVVATALQGTFVSLSLHEQNSTQEAKQWAYHLSNSFQESYSSSTR